MLLLDVDGVMTDGGIYFSERGDEMKKFNIQDGYGIVKLQRRGVMVGIIIIQFIVFMVAPPPYEGSARDWFKLFQ